MVEVVHAHNRAPLSDLGFFFFFHLRGLMQSTRWRLVAARQRWYFAVPGLAQCAVVPQFYKPCTYGVLLTSAASWGTDRETASWIQHTYCRLESADKRDDYPGNRARRNRKRSVGRVTLFSLSKLKSEILHVHVSLPRQANIVPQLTGVVLPNQAVNARDFSPTCTGTARNSSRGTNTDSRCCSVLSCLPHSTQHGEECTYVVVLLCIVHQEKITALFAAVCRWCAPVRSSSRGSCCHIVVCSTHAPPATMCCAWPSRTLCNGA